MKRNRCTHEAICDSFMCVYVSCSSPFPFYTMLSIYRKVLCVYLYFRCRSIDALSSMLYAFVHSLNKYSIDIILLIKPEKRNFLSLFISTPQQQCIANNRNACVREAKRPRSINRIKEQHTYTRESKRNIRDSDKRSGIITREFTTFLMRFLFSFSLGLSYNVY